jgi:uncharacterized damage-inducible protein DinB
VEIRTIHPSAQYFGKVQKLKMRLARCIPADKLELTNAPGKFTLGDLLRHIAVAERLMWVERLPGHASRYTTHGKSLADGFDNIIASVERLNAESGRIFTRLGDEEM